MCGARHRSSARASSPVLALVTAGSAVYALPRQRVQLRVISLSLYATSVRLVAFSFFMILRI
jgi:hypothetical protein